MFLSARINENLRPIENCQIDLSIEGRPAGASICFQLRPEGFVTNGCVHT